MKGKYEKAYEAADRATQFMPVGMVRFDSYNLGDEIKAMDVILKLRKEIERCNKKQKQVDNIRSASIWSALEGKKLGLEYAIALITELMVGD